MANEAYWLDDFTTLDLKTADSSATSTPVAGIQNVTIVPSVSIEKLRTADSIKAVDSKQDEFSVNVQIGYSKWDKGVVEQWLGGGGGASGTSMADTSDPQNYEISADFVSSDGSTTLSTTVTDITFEEMPIIDASRGEFVQWDLDGEGDDLTNFNTA